MLCTMNLCQDASLFGSTIMKPPFLPFDEPNLCNDYIFMDPEFSDFYCHCFLNPVDSKTNLLDNVILTKIIVRPIKKPRSVGPHKSKLEETTIKKKSSLKNKKFRSVSTLLGRESAKPSSNGNNELQ